MGEGAKCDVGLLHMLHQVGACVPGEKLVRPGAGDHGQLAGSKLQSVGGEGGRLLRP